MWFNREVKHMNLYANAYGAPGDSTSIHAHYVTITSSLLNAVKIYKLFTSAY